MTLVVKILSYLELVRFLMIRCQTGRKFSIQSLITTLTSFGTVCTDGRDIVESADRGMKVFNKGQFDFS